jgi:signal peptidase I
MIQFLRINNFRVDALKEDGFVEKSQKSNKEEFAFISGLSALWFFIKRIFYLIFIIYGTLFLAVSIPYFKLPFIPVYFIGSMIAGFYCCRLVNHFVKYFRFRKGKILIEYDEISLEKTIYDGNERDDGAEAFVIEENPSVVKKIHIFNSSKEIIISADEVTYIEHNLLGNLIIREKYFKTAIPIMLFSEEIRENLMNYFQDMAPKRTSIYRKSWEFLDAITVALFLAVHVIQFVLQAYYIPSPSMEDTLREGDQLFVEKLTFGPTFPKLLNMKNGIRMNFLGIREVKRKDVVIFNPPHEKEKDYIKRCIALSGDRLEIKKGSVYVNGKRLNEPYTKGVTIDDVRVSKIQGIVPKGKIVVFGDNRENSQDSRFFGYLDKNRIKGRAFVLYFNWNDIKKFNFTRIGFIR